MYERSLAAAVPLRLHLGPPRIALLRTSAEEKVEWLCTTRSSLCNVINERPMFLQQQTRFQE